MKLTAKIFSPKGTFRFLFSCSFDFDEFQLVEQEFNKTVVSLFGDCSYFIIQIEKL